MKTHSRAARATTDSPIRKMFNLASRMTDVISFTVGEPDFPTPDNIVQAAIRALREGQTHYTLNAGILPLRQAIAEATERSHGLRYDPEGEVMATVGGMQALMLLMLALVDPGDEVIISDPYWPNYVGQVKACGGVPVLVKVREEDGFVFDPGRVREARDAPDPDPPGQFTGQPHGGRGRARGPPGPGRTGGGAGPGGGLGRGLPAFPL